MNKIAIFYGPLGGNTEKVANAVAAAFGESNCVLLPVKDATEKDLEPYQNVVFGGPTIGTHTWRDQPDDHDWNQFLVRMSGMDLSTKKCAIFGLGDHISYAHHFVDDIGFLAERLENSGATLVGMVPVEDYEFESSKAQRGDLFLGLPVDEDFESEKTISRVGKWVEQLKQEF